VNNRPTWLRFGAVVTVILLLAGCHRDPNYAKQEYLKSGNKYFSRARYKEAMIMYRKAVATDPKFGEAYYRIALTYEALGQTASVVGVLRRATELMPAGTPDWNDAALKLGEILVQGAALNNKPGQNTKPLMDEVNQLQATLDQKAPNSFEDERLKAEISRADAAREVSQHDVPAFKKSLEDAIENLRKSLQKRPNDVQTSLTLARTLVVYGEPKEAEQIYRQLIVHDKTQTTAYAELYRLYAAEHRSDDAEQLLKEAIANNPKTYSFRTLLAAYYFSKNDRTRMVGVLDDIKAHSKEFPEAYLTAGDFYARIGDLDAAMREYKEGESKDAGKRSEYGKREVEILIRQNKRDEAYNKVLEMVKNDPKDADARGLKASFALDRGEVDHAISEFQEVVAQKPDNFVAHYDLGRAYAAKGEYQQAATQYREALRIRPDYLRPRIALAEAQLQLGTYDQALKTSQETEKLQPNNAAAKLVEGIALARMGQAEQARKVFEYLVKTTPKFGDAFLQLGSLDMAQKNFAGARENFIQARTLNPGDMRPLLGEAESYLAEKQPDKALAVFQAEVTAHPDRADLLKAFAELKSQLGQYDSAEADYKRLLDHFKESSNETAQTYASLGQLYARKGDYNLSISWLEKARALEPNSARLLLVLAASYEHVGRTRDAQAAYRSALAQDPGNGQALNNLAFSLTQHNMDLNEALTLANKAKQSMPDSAEVDDTLGCIYIKKNMPDAAVEQFRAITAKYPANPSFHYHYCEALYAKGDKVGAQKECNAALADKPAAADADGARQLLAKLQ
jgi:tetratricopeptide (TPR) repeat protein